MEKSNPKNTFKSQPKEWIEHPLIDGYKGTNWLHWRTREGPIRTASLLPFQIKIPFYESLPIHQVFADKIKQLKALGMTNQEIAERMKISRKTVKKGLAFFL